MPKVSVIIPIYNVEKYLIECLNSVSTQTLTDIEIICINDGSSDDSLLITEAFAEIDNRFYIFNQKNKGAGAARNRGLRFAQGDFIYFMDSDDYLETNTLEKTYNYAINKNVDFLMFKINNFYDETNEKFFDNYYTMPYLKKRVGKNIFNYNKVSDMALDLCVCPPGNLFNHEFIEDIRFPEGLLFEDNVFFTHALFKANRIYFHDEFLYNRRKRYDSTSSAPLIKLLDTIEITNQLIDLTNQYNHEKHKKELYYRIFPNIYSIFKQTDKSKKQEYFDKIKKEYEKSKDKWENDEFFNNDLNPFYSHMFNCVLENKKWKKFESCMDKYIKNKNKENESSRLKRIFKR